MSFSELGGWQLIDDAGRRKYVNGAERQSFITATQGLRPDVRALCRVLAYTGCRVSEALGVKRCHVDAERRTVTIRTLKRRRLIFRVVPIPGALIDELLALPTLADGRLWSMHRTTAWRHVKRLMISVGIESGPRCCCRGLRHGFGMMAASKAVPINLIGRWLGHASTATTSIYVDAVGLEERSFADRMWS